jgi:hypothetical protein
MKLICFSAVVLNYESKGFDWTIDQSCNDADLGHRHLTILTAFWVLSAI